MKVDADVIEILKSVETDGNKLRITQKLDRTIYQKVNKTLSGLGGKWSSKEKAHIFEKDVSEIIRQIVETGEYKDLRLTTLQKLPVVIPVFLIKVYQKLTILTMKYNHFYQQYPLESLLLLDKVPYYRIVFL